MGDFRKKKCPADWFREEKSMQINSWEKISCAERNIAHDVRCWKNSQTKSVKSPITHSPSNVQWSCQPFRGWGKKPIWHLEMSSINKMAGARSSCGSFQDQSFALKIENTPIKDTNGKRKFKRMLSFPFVDKRKLFAMGLSFYCFLHGGWEGLACFESTRQRGFWRHFRYIPYPMIKEKYVFKRKFLYL